MLHDEVMAPGAEPVCPRARIGGTSGGCSTLGPWHPLLRGDDASVAPYLCAANVARTQRRPDVRPLQIRPTAHDLLRSSLAVARAAAALLSVSPMLCGAVEFESRGLQTLFNFEASYGARYRVESADEKLIGIINGGVRNSVDSDDGTLNYGTGLASQMVRATGEAVALYGNVSFYGRAAAFHDWAQDGDLDRTRLSSEGQDLVGSGAELLDHYIGFSYTIGDVPIYSRIGDQVVSWADTGYLRDGLDLINPIDFATASQPASQVLDARSPQGMAWFAASLSNVLAVEGYYQYEWRPTILPPIGSYLSGLDAFGGDGLGSLFLGGGVISDLGTDLDAQFHLPAGTLGFDPDFNRFPGVTVDGARDGGQFGLSLFARWLGGLAPKLSVSYMRYHSRLPVISTRTGDAAAIAATSEAAVAALAEEFVGAYVGQGLDLDAAEQAARATSEALTISRYANAAGYRVEYPEDIHVVGAGFSVASMRTGTLLSLEVSRHFRAPYQLAVGTLINAALSPIAFDPAIGSTPLGEFDADVTISGYRRGERTQAALGLARVLSRRFGADLFISGFNVGWVHVHDTPGTSEVPYELGGRSNDAWGAQIFMAATYNSVIGGLNLTPRMAYARDLDGTTPGPTAMFLEGRATFATGVTLDLLQRYEADLSYVRFMGAGSRNQLRDRDQVQLRVSVYF